MKEEHEDYPSVIEAFFLIVGLFAVEYVAGIILHDLGMYTAATRQDVSGIVAILGFGILFSALLTYKKLSYRDLFHQSRHSISATLGRLSLPILLLIPAIVLTVSALMSVLTWYFPLSPWNEAMFDGMMSNNVATVVTTCMIAPVLEEMLFRGIILRSFLRQYTPAVAITASALLFGLAHLNIYQFMVGSLTGLLLGWLYERTRSLWPGILLHAAYNSSVTWLYIGGYKAENRQDAPTVSLLYWILAFAVAYGASTILTRLLRNEAIGRS